MPDGMPNASTSFVLTFESVGRENPFLADTALWIQSVSLNDMGWGACEIYSWEGNPTGVTYCVSHFSLAAEGTKTEGTSKSVNRISA